MTIGTLRVNPDDLLFLILRPRLAFALLPGTSKPWHEIVDESRFCLGDSRLQVLYPSLTMFYDFLRNAAGDILAVRYWIDDETLLARLQTEVLWLPYVELGVGGRAIEIYFSADRDVYEEGSCDQGFVLNRAFITDMGHWIIMMLASEIGGRGIASLFRAGIDREVVEIG